MVKELLKKLIAADSSPNCGELAAAEVLANFFSSANLKPAVEKWDSNRANITATVSSTGQKPAILFVSHLDVVPADKSQWQSDPFEPVEKNGKIYGRGSCDMKAGLAAAAVAIAEIAKSGVELKGGCIFSATAGEETDSCGIHRFLKNFDKSNINLCGAIVPEPTDFELIGTHRGLLWLKVTTTGKTAHGSMPQHGINAIESMRLFLNEFDNYSLIDRTDEILGTGSKSTNSINGGVATNVVPDSCNVEIDIRTIPQQSHEKIVANIEAILSKLSKQQKNFKGKVEIIRSVEALKSNTDNSFAKQIIQASGQSQINASAFTTDAPFVAKLGIPVLICGPGKSDICHKPDEYIEISDLRKAVDLYKKIILCQLV